MSKIETSIRAIGLGGLAAAALLAASPAARAAPAAAPATDMASIQQQLNAMRVPTKSDSKLEELRNTRRFRKELVVAP